MKLKKILFGVLAALLPLAFLALVEFSLWIFNAYPQPPLFLEVEDGGKAYTQINPQVGERYFNKNLMPVPNLYPQKFSREKQAGTMRIFCLGGSSTAGFPYEMTVPFPEQLALLLQADYPDMNFEVINMGLSAINSFTIVDWIPDVLRQDPDLILLYMGHNEFYGAYGTGSTISLGNDGRFVRLILKLQKFRVVQMISSMIRSITAPPSTEDNPTLMEKVIADKFIESTSMLRIKTRDNFAANLKVILSKCQSAGVPVIMSNLVSNIKDQVPLDITANPELETTKAYDLYLQGKHQFSQGDTITAHLSFTRAKNNDQVPFRGIDYLNEILHNRADNFGLTIIDMKSAFRKASASTIPGYDLFCDHLHPNPLGYHVMARQFEKAMTRSGILSEIPSHKRPMEPLLVTDLDWEIGALRIFKLLHRWPFGNSQVDYSDYVPLYNEETSKIAQDYLFDHSIWGKAHSEMADYYLKQNQFSNACDEFMAIIAMYPEKIEFYTKLIDCAKGARLWEVVANTSENALARSSEKGMFYYNLAISQRMMGHMDKAITFIEKAVKAPELTAVESANVHFTYARFLIEEQHTSEAAVVLTELVESMPEFVEAQELLAKLIN